MTMPLPKIQRTQTTANRNPRRVAGFTLLELIVAIGVFAVMAAMAYGGLSAVLNTRAALQRTMARTTIYQKAYLRMRDDFQNAADRTIKDGTDETLPSVLYDTYRQRIEFTRAGWPNPLGLPRTGLQRVAYYLDERGQLIRESWNVLDRAPRSEPDDLAVLDGVDKWAIRFLDNKNQWQEQWPPSSDLSQSASPTENQSDVPAVVELRLNTRDWGELRFLFQMRPNIGSPQDSNSTNVNSSTSGKS